MIMKKAFTLIELLIVIGIIAILAGVLLSTFGGATESARLAKCQSNMRNLAAAANSYAMETGYYPLAGSEQYMSAAVDDDSGDILIRVGKGWVSWLDQGKFRGNVTAAKSVSQSSYMGNEADVTHALTNGAIWRAVGRNRSVYQCPVHLKTCQVKTKTNPGWSYAMNSYFGCEKSAGEALAECNHKYMTRVERADRRLLFAEIPGLLPEKVNLKKYGAESLPDVDFSAGSKSTDGILQYEENESIGFNHIRGRNIVGLVAFADGHTEALVIPKDGNFKELTEWLCKGYDIGFSSGKYEKMEGASDD